MTDVARVFPAFPSFFPDHPISRVEVPCELIPDAFRISGTGVPSLCSKTSEYARQCSSRAASVDSCCPARTMRQIGEDRRAGKQRPGRLLCLPSCLDHPLRRTRTHRRGHLQVRITRLISRCLNSQFARIFRD